MPASSAMKIRKLGSFLDRSLTSAEHNEIENAKEMNKYRSFRTMLLYMIVSIIIKGSEFEVKIYFLNDMIKGIHPRNKQDAGRGFTRLTFPYRLLERCYCKIRLYLFEDKVSF